MKGETDGRATAFRIERFVWVAIVCHNRVISLLLIALIEQGVMSCCVEHDDIPSLASRTTKEC